MSFSKERTFKDVVKNGLAPFPIFGGISAVSVAVSDGGKSGMSKIVGLSSLKN